MEKNRSGLFVYYRWLVLLLASGLCLLPLWATVIGGFKSPGELRTNAFGLPREWLFDNYVSIAISGRFWQMLGNSAFIALVTVVLTLLVSSMAAFVLAHLRFAGKRWLANYLALGLTFPFATAVLPVFIRVRDLGLLDSYWGVILPQIAFNLGFAIVLLQGFFAELPNELFEAAFVDGCSYPRMFWQITMPLSRPILATVGCFPWSGAGTNTYCP
jgi:raffinose/stachyose/melibiose transport system permease protein